MIQFFAWLKERIHFSIGSMNDNCFVGNNALHNEQKSAVHL